MTENDELISGKKINFYIFALTWVFRMNENENLAGGVNNIFQLIKRINRNKYNIIVITTQEGKKLLKRYNSEPDEILIVSKINNKVSFLLAWMLVTFKGLMFLPRIDKSPAIFYCESEFLPNTIVASFYKYFRKKALLMVCIRSLAPKQFSIKDLRVLKDVLYNFSQELSIILFKLLNGMFFAVNTSIENLLISRHVKKENIFVIDNGADVNKIKILIPKSTLVYDGVFMGRIMHHKGVLDLIEIWDDVVKYKATAKLAIVGSGEQYFIDQVSKEIIKRNLSENIDLIGFISGDNRFEVLKSSKIFLLPSYLEGKPLVFFEAMACGIPILTYELQYYIDFFQDVIMTVPVGNKKMFGRKLISLLDNEKECLRIRENGYKFVNYYEWDKVIERNLSFIEKSFSKKKW